MHQKTDFLKLFYATHISFNLTWIVFIWLVTYSFSLQGEQINSSKQKMFLLKHADEYLY